MGVGGHEHSGNRLSTSVNSSGSDTGGTLARASLESAGYLRVSALEGFDRLALPSEGQQAFFAHRVVYVSFHADENARPEYVA